MSSCVDCDSPLTPGQEKQKRCYRCRVLARKAKAGYVGEFCRTCTRPLDEDHDKKPDGSWYKTCWECRAACARYRAAHHAELTAKRQAHPRRMCISIGCNQPASTKSRFCRYHVDHKRNLSAEGYEMMRSDRCPVCGVTGPARTDLCPPWCPTCYRAMHVAQTQEPGDFHAREVAWLDAELAKIHAQAERPADACCAGILQPVGGSAAGAAAAAGPMVRTPAGDPDGVPAPGQG
ncbi:MAG: hypothetical protein WC683_07290 [bacterium]